MPIVKTKCQRSAVVSVSCRKIDSREREARELVSWLKTLDPELFIGNPEAVKILGKATDSVDILKELVSSDFGLKKFFFDNDHLRVSKWSRGRWNMDDDYSTTYMEWFPESDHDEQHYESLCSQNFQHVVDAFKALKIRFESIHPANPAVGL